ncbi:PucR family transcriptional regulator ligand-binding domain-containing protein [Streptomyces sp. Edi4]|uniref:PucR family transcriptional regulator ligand-binding domain-containing protein n=1 Tax=Streptomyces sp. Edi4 TaxID=3162527 RepID=UPI003305F8B0
MRVGDLLQMEGLGLSLVWGGENLLRREIGGVTATDLEDPTRFLRSGEIALSGLVWWNAADGPARTRRFVSALARSGANALLAGEESHGAVPADLVDSRRDHGIALLAVSGMDAGRLHPRGDGDAGLDAPFLHRLHVASRRCGAAPMGGAAGPRGTLHADQHRTPAAARAVKPPAPPRLSR